MPVMDREIFNNTREENGRRRENPGPDNNQGIFTVITEFLVEMLTLTTNYYLTPIIVAILVVIWLTITAERRNRGRLVSGFGIRINFPLQAVRVRIQTWIGGQTTIGINVVLRWPWEWI